MTTGTSQSSIMVSQVPMQSSIMESQVSMQSSIMESQVSMQSFFYTHTQHSIAIPHQGAGDMFAASPAPMKDSTKGGGRPKAASFMGAG